MTLTKIKFVGAGIMGSTPDCTMEIMQALRVENLGDVDHSAIDLFYENIAKTKIEE